MNGEVSEKLTTVSKLTSPRNALPGRTHIRIDEDGVVRRLLAPLYVAWAVMSDGVAIIRAPPHRY